MIPSVVVLGLPKAGKSSFIAALSHILQFQEVPTLLKLDRLSAEDKYLFEMRSSWQNCEPFERTGGGPVHAITLHLKTEDASQVDLFFPDIVGEEFEEQWRGREWSAEFSAAVSSASALLLFLNPLTLKKPLSIADVANAEAAILDALGTDDQTDESEPKDLSGEDADSSLQVTVQPDQPLGHLISDTGEAIAREVARQGNEDTLPVRDSRIWNPRDADSQVKIVDLLQAIASFDQERRWRLGVIVSAWDIVREQMSSITPAEWFWEECPLISQYLQSNPIRFHCNVFGVSAQGGNPTKDAEKLRAFDAQSERVQVVYDQYEGHDLTRVLSWAMSSQ